MTPVQKVQYVIDGVTLPAVFNEHYDLPPINHSIYVPVHPRIAEAIADAVPEFIVGTVPY